MNSRNNSLVGFLVIVFIIGVDQITKLLLFQSSTLNKGIAFGLLENKPYLVLVLYLLISILLIFFFLKSKKTNLEYFGWYILLGGITSNLIDKIRIGSIIDPIALTRLDISFNLADIAITAATAIIIFAKLIK